MVAIVISRSARMPSTCLGKYKYVAVIDVSPEIARAGFTAPLDARNKSIKILWKSSPAHVGKTERSAFYRVLQQASEIAERYNRKSKNGSDRAKQRGK